MANRVLGDHVPEVEVAHPDENSDHIIIEEQMRSLLSEDMPLYLIHVIVHQWNLPTSEVSQTDVDEEKKQNCIVKQRFSHLEANVDDKKKNDKTVELVECYICESEAVAERRVLPVDVLDIERNQNIERVIEAVSVFL